MPADQFLPAVAETLAGLVVDVEDDRIVVKQKERVGRVIHEGTEARLARTQLLLRSPQLRDVLQDAELAQWPPRSVSRYVTMAAHHSLGAVGADHSVFDVVARAADAQRRLRGPGYSRPVVRVNDA